MKRLSEVATESGVSVRQAQHWVAKGWLPGVQAHVGSGHYRVLTDEQAFHLQVMADLVHLGMLPAKASKVASKVVKTGGSAHFVGKTVTVRVHS